MLEMIIEILVIAILVAFLVAATAAAIILILYVQKLWQLGLPRGETELEAMREKVKSDLYNAQRESEESFVRYLIAEAYAAAIKKDEGQLAQEMAQRRMEIEILKHRVAIEKLQREAAGIELETVKVRQEIDNIKEINK